MMGGSPNFSFAMVCVGTTSKKCSAICLPNCCEGSRTFDALFLVVFRRKPGSQEARADTWVALGQIKASAIAQNYLESAQSAARALFRRVSGANPIFALLAKTSIKN